MSFAVFLDVDGVLNSRKSYVGSPEGHVGVTPFRIRILAQAIERYQKSDEEVVLVLTSDWKLKPEIAQDYRYLVSELDKYGLKISGKTTDESYKYRGGGIIRYLDENPDIKDFVILDDNLFDFEEYPRLWERLLLTKQKKPYAEGIDVAHFASETPAVAAILFLDDIMAVAKKREG